MSSSYSQSLDEHIFEYIENDIRKYSELENILLAGDLNARTGSGELDFIECDSNYNHIHHDEYIPDSDLPIRYSKDNVVTSRRRELKDFCIYMYSGLRILNCRIIGDFSGQMTCHTPNQYLKA